MPLSDGDIVQSNQGTGTTVTLGAGTTVGNALRIFATIGGGSISGVTGLTLQTPSLSVSTIGGWAKAAVAAETSWTITTAVAGPIAWYVEERSGLDPTSPVDVTPAVHDASLTSATTALTSTYDGVGYGLHSSYNSTGGVAATLGSHTNGYAEIAEQSANDGTKAVVLSVSRKYLQSLGTQQVTATASGTTPTSSASVVAVYTAAGAKRAADVRLCAGFEIGSTTGLTTVVSGTTYADIVNGSPAIISGGRTGAYCLELSASAAVESVHWLTSGALSGAGSIQVGRVSVYLPTLPTGDLELFYSGQVRVWFRSASGKIGVQVASGTEQLSDAAVSAATWFSVGWRNNTTTTAVTSDWRVTYTDGSTPVEQTQATGTGTAVASAIVLGWQAASTGTVRYDDLVISNTAGHYPLGDMGVYPIKVDPAGTLTISGTTANFQTFASNGTGTAWNATTARDAIDDIPPTIGGSADGIMQITAAGSDYVAIPLETVDLASIPGSIRGVRLCFAGWAASGTAATIGFRAHDGSTEHTLYPVADPGFDNAAEMWVCAMVRPLSGRIDWTQAKLDALTARVGFSNDAAPDIGIHALVGEAVVRKTETVPVFGEPGGLPRVEQDVDPDSGGIVSLRAYTDTGQSGTLTWYNAAGSPTPVAVAAASNPQTITLNAVDVPSTPRLEFVINE